MTLTRERGDGAYICEACPNPGVQAARSCENHSGTASTLSVISKIAGDPWQSMIGRKMGKLMGKNRELLLLMRVCEIKEQSFRFKADYPHWLAQESQLLLIFFSGSNFIHLLDLDLCSFHCSLW